MSAGELRTRETKGETRGGDKPSIEHTAYETGGQGGTRATESAVRSVNGSIAMGRSLKAIHAALAAVISAPDAAVSCASVWSVDCDCALLRGAECRSPNGCVCV